MSTSIIIIYNINSWLCVQNFCATCQTVSTKVKVKKPAGKKNNTKKGLYEKCEFTQ